MTPVRDVSDRYSIRADGRLLDIAGMAVGDVPLVLNPGGRWTTFEGTLGEITDSRPIPDSEVDAVIARLIAAGS